MLITDRFVFVFLPRTGTTFARNAIKTLCARTGTGLVEHKANDLQNKYLPHNRQSLHARVEQIPSEHAGKTVVSIMRNPFEIYVSQFLFGAWARYPELFDMNRMSECYPSFPKLTFSQFTRMINDWNINMLRPDSIPAGLGALTHQFIQFFCPDPDRILAEMARASTWPRLADALTPSLRLLRTESLRSDLAGFLVEMGFDEEQTDFIKTEANANVSGGREGDYHSYFTPELRGFVSEREHMLFDMFPEYSQPSEGFGP